MLAFFAFSKSVILRTYENRLVEKQMISSAKLKSGHGQRTRIISRCISHRNKLENRSDASFRGNKFHRGCSEYILYMYSYLQGIIRCIVSEYLIIYTYTATITFLNEYNAYNTRYKL